MYATIKVWDDSDHLLNKNGVSNNRGSWDDTVVPTITHVLEGVRITYRKIRLMNREEHIALAESLYSYSTLTYIPSEINNDGFPIEVIVLHIFKDNENFETYVAGAMSQLFIMNEQGKTISQITCNNK